MAVTRRYSPEWAQGDDAVVGMDFSPIIPSGVGISNFTMGVFTNTAVPSGSSDFSFGASGIEDRIVYQRIRGGVAGTDYRLAWTAYDTNGNIWTRSALMLCAPTS